MSSDLTVLVAVTDKKYCCICSGQYRIANSDMLWNIFRYTNCGIEQNSFLRRGQSDWQRAHMAPAVGWRSSLLQSHTPTLPLGLGSTFTTALQTYLHQAHSLTRGCTSWPLPVYKGSRGHITHATGNFCRDTFPDPMAEGMCGVTHNVTLRSFT